MDEQLINVLVELLLCAASFGFGVALYARYHQQDTNALKQQVNILSAQLFNVKLALDDKSKAFTVLCTERDMQNIVISQRGDELHDALKLPVKLQAEIDTAAYTNKQATAIIKNLRTTVQNQDIHVEELLQQVRDAEQAKGDMQFCFTNEVKAHKLTAQQYTICKHDWDSVVGLWCTDRPNLIGGRFKSAFYRIGYKGERL